MVKATDSYSVDSGFESQVSHHFDIGEKMLSFGVYEKNIKTNKEQFLDSINAEILQLRASYL